MQGRQSDCKHVWTNTRNVTEIRRSHRRDRCYETLTQSKLRRRVLRSSPLWGGSRHFFIKRGRYAQVMCLKRGEPDSRLSTSLAHTGPSEIVF
jgi:hypothetical protein